MVVLERSELLTVFWLKNLEGSTCWSPLSSMKTRKSEVWRPQVVLSEMLMINPWNQGQRFALRQPGWYIRVGFNQTAFWDCFFLGGTWRHRWNCDRSASSKGQGYLGWSHHGVGFGWLQICCDSNAWPKHCCWTSLRSVLWSQSPSWCETGTSHAGSCALLGRHLVFCEHRKPGTWWI